jgi:uncharacterized protein YggE
MGSIKDGIHVFGEGVISVTADTLKVHVGVVTEGDKLETIQAQNAETSSRVIQAMINLGVRREDIRTIDYRIDPQYQYEDGKQQFIGYRVTHMLEIKTKQIKEAGRIVDVAVENGANLVANIQFSVENDKHYYQHALTLAAKDALKKAESLAYAYRASIYQIPYLIEEIQQPSGPIPLSYTTFKAEAQTPIEPGKLTILAQIKAYFHIMFPR